MTLPMPASRRVSRRILGASVGAALSLAGCSTQKQAPAPSEPSRIAVQPLTNAQADLANDFHRFEPAPLYDGPERRGAVAAIHIENRGSGRRMDRFPARHGLTAADITDRAADRAAGGNVRTEFMDGDPHFDTNILRRAFARTRVVTNSERAWSDRMDIRAACAFFDTLPGLLVTPIGNEGRGSDKAYQPEDPNLTQCDDVILRVGALEKGKVAVYSTRAGADIAGENPFNEGFRYRYLPTVAEYDEVMSSQRGKLLKEWLEKARANEIDRLNGVIESNRDKGNTDIAAGTKWLEAMQALPQIVASKGAAFDALMAKATGDFNKRVLDMRNGLIAGRGCPLPGVTPPAKPIEYDARKPDADNFVDELHGTSFTTPAVGGYIAGRAWSAPDVSDEELMVAALVSAQKLGAAFRNEADMVWVKTARGMLFNPTHVGFGAFDPAAFDGAVKRMQELRQQGAAAPARILGEGNAVAAAGSLRKGVGIDIAADAVAMRTQLILQLPKMPDNPPVIEIVAPDGTVIPAMPAAHKGDKDSGIWTVNISGFLGTSTAGRWTVRAATDAPAFVTMRQVSVQHGSTVDRIVAEYAQRQLPPKPGQLATLPAARWVGGPALKPTSVTVTPRLAPCS